MAGFAALPLVELLLVLGIVLAVVGAVLLVRRRFADPLNEDSDSIYAVSAAITSVYGLVLGLTLAAAWERYQHAEVTLVEESNALFTLSRAAGSLEPIDRDRLRDFAIAYANAVVGVELTGQHPDEIDGSIARQSIRGLYETMGDLHPPADEAAQLAWPEAVSTVYGEIVALDRARGDRLALANLHLPQGFWLVIYGGAVLTIGSLAVIHPSNFRLHVVITVSATVLIVALLLLVRELDRPFEGARTVDLSSFQGGVRVLEKERAMGLGIDPASPAAATPEAGS